MPAADDAYASDLAKLPVQYQSQIQNFIEEGARPEDRDLLALVCGDYRAVLRRRSPDLAAVIRMIESHCPDYAYGSPEFVIRWEKIRKK